MTSTIEWHERLRKTIPWGSSTCSKAPSLLPEEPAVIVKGKGCRVWDADGNEYIDFRNGLGPVTLGYQFPEVDEAIRDQLGSGIIFGHAHPLEAEVAELLCELVPCAEQARFLKTGGEAIAAAIRIARTYTGRDRIIQIGYNGWVNSLSGSGQSLPGQAASGKAVPGVPNAVGELHHAAPWNDIAALERWFDHCGSEIAAVVIAADYASMADGKTFYPAVRELTRKHGALLIYDEIVTGFRIAIGGVQQYFGVQPDLAVFSKGMANGMPLSAYVGSKDVMKACDRGGTVISSTFGGETLSLAASKATMTVYKEQDVVGHLWRQGEHLWGGLNGLFDRYEVPLELKGFWPCPTFTLKTGASPSVREQFMRLAYRNGVSLYNVSYVNYSHKDADITEALERMELACKQLAEARAK
ncbi:aminotransferase class III-fold pyridoxal phosphate-dependent enzyme [Paenibacillus ginsengarvi]|uniref:Aminotransferase class III-fold pyridoxal phosphate-dependent enzyme n=1 Tax=Paenibacillus ginsengarvi TaxID=400777 RepID=A0A3B0BKB6_9BACL|nr:aminotransferase class III-fold pyridoxal phosphate-dependent enzyme [Paenibacillus ginsengarvi]RKN72417.1 aminotransferase class III-fold pyridoxal phosphate-dependent enzyme [Paenibacillus ginsengarvi]